ncbi:MAG: peptidyl-tRNA hydrolase [Gammaproteobacteria bacterium]|nr:MAG: peptidyl-tRNA hydrolase [Gammaproteobacteria bacterium]
MTATAGAEAPELIVGLGNPGARYAATRHNAGFWFVERLAEALDAAWRPNKRVHGELAEGRWDGRTLRLLKPDTFMNHAGRAVAAAAGYWRIPPGRILVVHDDLDLPPGAVRLKRGGGHGGHNGLRDILAALGDAGFWRLRLGIGHPGLREAVVGYVLGAPDPDQRAAIENAIERALAEREALLSGRMAAVMQALHGAGA